MSQVANSCMSSGEDSLDVSAFILCPSPLTLFSCVLQVTQKLSIFSSSRIQRISKLMFIISLEVLSNLIYLDFTEK